jgi:hypothetical protein
MVSVLASSVVDRGFADVLSDLSPFYFWMNEWLLFNANSAIFQLCYGENKLIFNEMMMRSALF